VQAQDAVQSVQTGAQVVELFGARCAGGVAEREVRRDTPGETHDLGWVRLMVAVVSGPPSEEARAG
jgi:hypothetical protein